MRPVFTALFSAFLLCACHRPPAYGFRVLNQSTNELILFQISSSAGDVLFPPIASANANYATAYGAPGSDVAVFVQPHLLGISLPARFPGEQIAITSVIEPRVTNILHLSISKADRNAVRQSHGNFLFIVKDNGAITLSTEPGH